MLHSISSRPSLRVYRVRNISASAPSLLAGVLKTLAIAALLLGAGTYSRAQESDPGRFEIRSAEVVLDAGVYFLDAWMELRLPPEAREALRSGVPLTIRLDVELTYDRRWWADASVAGLRQRYQVDYHALTERYVVTNLNSRDRTSFPTLFAALNDLGRIERLPLIDAALLEPRRRYDVRLRVVLDTERYPGPLRLLAFWRKDFSIASDWYEWRLDDV